MRFRNDAFFKGIALTKQPPKKGVFYSNIHRAARPLRGTDSRKISACVGMGGFCPRLVPLLYEWSGLTCFHQPTKPETRTLLASL